MTDDGLEARYKRAFIRKFFVRFDMSLILTGTFLAGVAANRLLYLLGLTWMPSRYALAVLASYLAFFALVRLWFAYCRWTWRKLVPDGDLSFDIGGWSRGGGGRAVFAGRGGGFGGAGAQGSWSESAVSEPTRVASAQLTGPSPGPGPSGGSRWLPNLSLDIDLDEKAIVILLAFFVLVLSIAGVAAYMIWSAPSILAEGAFQLALSTSLVKRIHRVESAGWAASMWRSTWIPFTVVLLVTVGFALVVHHYCPHAPTLKSVWTHCLRKAP